MATQDIRNAFWRWQAFPEAQPFSGGVLDAWPQRMAEALAFAKREWAVVVAYVTEQSKKAKEVPGG